MIPTSGSFRPLRRWAFLQPSICDGLQGIPHFCGRESMRHPQNLAIAPVVRMIGPCVMKRRYDDWTEDCEEVCAELRRRPYLGRDGGVHH